MVVSIVASVLGYRSAGEDRKARIVLSHMDRAHEQTLARQEREEARRLVAYSALTMYLDDLSEEVRRTLPLFQLATEPPLPKQPGREEMRRHVAAARLVGSDELRGSLQGVWEAKREFDIAALDVLDLRQAGVGQGATDIREAREKLDLCRQTVLDAVDRVEAQVRSDLGILDPAAEAPRAQAQ